MNQFLKFCSRFDRDYESLFMKDLRKKFRTSLAAQQKLTFQPRMYIHVNFLATLYYNTRASIHIMALCFCVLQLMKKNCSSLRYKSTNREFFGCITTRLYKTLCLLQPDANQATEKVGNSSEHANNE